MKNMAFILRIMPLPSDRFQVYQVYMYIHYNSVGSYQPLYKPLVPPIGPFFSIARPIGGSSGFYMGQYMAYCVIRSKYQMSCKYCYFNDVCIIIL